MMRILLFLLVFLMQSASSKAITYEYRDGLGLIPSWVRWDMCVGYREDANRSSRMILYMYQVDTGNTAFGTFSGGGKVMYDDHNYFVYGPIDKAHDRKDRTALAVSYTGQMQMANANPDHIYKYDYMVAKDTVTASLGDFTLKHLGSVLRVELPMQRDMRVTRMVMKTSGDRFATNATVCVDEETITPTAFCDSMELKMDSLVIGKGDALVAYLMLPATDFTDDTLVIKVASDDGTITSARVKGCKVSAGLLYNIKVGEEGEEIEGSENSKETKNSDLSDNSDNSENSESSDNSEYSENSEHSENSDYSPLQAKPAEANLDADGNETSPTGLLTPLPMATPDDGQFLTLNTLIGDVNGDGEVTMSDANMVVNIFLGGNVAGADINAADINGDGEITMADANGIVNLFLNGQ